MCHRCESRPPATLSIVHSFTFFHTLICLFHHHQEGKGEGWEGMCHRCESRPPAVLLHVTLQACNQPLPDRHHNSSISPESQKLGGLEFKRGSTSLPASGNALKDYRLATNHNSSISFLGHKFRGSNSIT